VVVGAVVGVVLMVEAVVGERKAYTGFWSENLKERDHLGDPALDEMIILRWIFIKGDVGTRTGSI
jgi:hypothetical protein